MTARLLAALDVCSRVVELCEDTFFDPIESASPEWQEVYRNAKALVRGNDIPPMTDPQGRHWEQPDRRLIETDATHALMSRETFEALGEYSASIPTGVYPGKMWSRHDGDWDPRCKAADRRWLLCWYGESHDPGKCSINYREILIV